jgi:hypothetical protein
MGVRSIMIKKSILIFLSILFLLSGCNKNKEVTETIDKFELQFDTEHFKFNSKKQDKECLKDLSDALEDNYKRITSDLHINLNRKVDVYIYSDLDTYHKAINQPDAPKWAVGNADPSSGTIHMVNPLNGDGRPYSDFMKVIIHEFTHVVVINMNSNIYSIPLWLSEGIATYEAKQYSGNEVKSISPKLGATPLKDLESDYINFGNKSGYQISYSVVEYMIKNYGYDKVIDYIKYPDQVEKILGVSKEELQKNWLDYVNSK